MRLLKENNLKFTDTLHIGDKLVIPESYTIKNVKNADDVMNLMGFDKDFLNGFIGMEGFRNDIYIDITQVEFQILEYFFRNQGTALGRTDILNYVWGADYYGEEKIVDVNIRRVRKKIEDDPSNPKHLLTIWGLGYKWV